MDLSRVSVQSLVNELSDTTLRQCDVELERAWQCSTTDAASTIYGYDLGLPDADTPKNEDYQAVARPSSTKWTVSLEHETQYSSTEPHGKEKAFGSRGYYNEPVLIRISTSLEPLPPLLMKNQMNLLYFHHFLNHTARILVPHDCERNPFRHILPESKQAVCVRKTDTQLNQSVAVQDENIMNLLLAYSAAHRARMLQHAEPANRIAHWVQDVFPRLRQKLNEEPYSISNNTLATVIMMASLEIICSGTFEVPIPWQNHLTMARQMVIQRGGPKGMGRQDRIAYFLSRWFAYLDVLGSLSGNKNDTPLGSSYWSTKNASADEYFEIDCLMGFTTRCVGSLARISELAKRCEPRRIDRVGNVREDWAPTSDIVREATEIRQALEEGLLGRNIRKGCNHHHGTSSGSDCAWNATEIYATNKLCK
jgi:hypothetical protein